jgi:uncharacterized membrane protein (UPF0182 family)
MHFFVTNSGDPIIKVYQRAFPDLFTPLSQADSIPGLKGITAHFRYPEDIFRVQTNMYGRYHLTNPNDFYSQAQAWSVSPDPGSGQLSSSSPLLQTIVGNNGQFVPAPVQRLQPQYVLAHPPGSPSTQQSFLLLTPFVPVGSSTERQNLTAFMTASSDPGNYGALTVYQTPPGQTIDGPALITNAIRSNPAISSELTLLNQQGSNVELGEVAVVPIDQTLLYVQPVYVESSANQIPTLKDVVVVYNSIAYQSSNASLDNALCQIQNPQDGSRPFSSYCNTPEARAAPLVGPGAASNNNSATGSTGTTPSTTPGSTPSTTPAPATPLPPPAGASTSVPALLAKAQASFAAAQSALKTGDLAGYQADIQQGINYVNQAQAASSGAKTGGARR